MSQSGGESNNKSSFRNFVDSEHQQRVQEFYRHQHTSMTYDQVLEYKAKHLTFDKCAMSTWAALEYLDNIIDDSDPDTDASQIQHALQSAEAARKEYPDLDWLHLVCLIHDLGKVLAVTDSSRRLQGDPQWAVVGDTFPVGCAFEESIVFHDSFANNPDINHPVYSTKFGIYKPNCGLDKVHFSWGHDEYLFQVLQHNGSTLPNFAKSIIRYHSFYAWHKSGGYNHLTNEVDEENLKWIQVFNQFDLYSKNDTPQDVEKLRPYYEQLIKKYLPDIINW